MQENTYDKFLRQILMQEHSYDKFLRQILTTNSYTKCSYDKFLRKKILTINSYTRKFLRQILMQDNSYDKFSRQILTTNSHNKFFRKGVLMANFYARKFLRQIDMLEKVYVNIGWKNYRRIVLEGRFYMVLKIWKSFFLNFFLRYIANIKNVLIGKGDKRNIWMELEKRAFEIIPGKIKSISTNLFKA